MTLLFACLILAAQDEAARAREILSSAGAALKDAPTLRATCEHTYAGTDRRRTVTLMLKRPSLWRFESTGPGNEAHEVIFDGRMVWWHVKANKTYVKGSTPKSAIDLWGGALAHLYLDPTGASLVEGATRVSLKKETLDGADCNVVCVERLSVRTETEIWIDKEKKVRKQFLRGRMSDSGAEQ